MQDSWYLFPLLYFTKKLCSWWSDCLSMSYTNCSKFDISVIARYRIFALVWICWISNNILPISFLFFQYLLPSALGIATGFTWKESYNHIIVSYTFLCAVQQFPYAAYSVLSSTIWPAGLYTQEKSCVHLEIDHNASCAWNHQCFPTFNFITDMFCTSSFMQGKKLVSFVIL